VRKDDIEEEKIWKRSCVREDCVSESQLAYLWFEMGRIRSYGQVRKKFSTISRLWLFSIWKCFLFKGKLNMKLLEKVSRARIQKPSYLSR